MTPTEPEGAGASSLSSLMAGVSQLPVTISFCFVFVLILV